MKKTILGTVLLSAVVLSAGVVNTYAAEEVTKVADTDVEVRIDEGGVIVVPGPYKDKLSLVYRPDFYKFVGSETSGSVQLSNENENSGKNFIVVNDDRKDANGDRVGGNWKLTGKLSQLDGKDKDGNPASLPSKMTIAPGKLLTYDIGPLNPDGVDYAPAPIGSSRDEVANGLNFKLDTFTMEAGEAAVPFLTADATAAKAQPGVKTNLGDAKLDIATGNVKEGSYKGKVTWTLSTEK